MSLKLLDKACDHSQSADGKVTNIFSFNYLGLIILPISLLEIVEKTFYIKAEQYFWDQFFVLDSMIVIKKYCNLLGIVTNSGKCSLLNFDVTPVRLDDCLAE